MAFHFVLLTFRYSPAMDAKTYDTPTYLMNRFCKLAPIYWLVNLALLVAENDFYEDFMSGITQ